MFDEKKIIALLYKILDSVNFYIDPYLLDIFIYLQLILEWMWVGGFFLGIFLFTYIGWLSNKTFRKTILPKITLYLIGICIAVESLVLIGLFLFSRIFNHFHILAHEEACIR